MVGMTLPLRILFGVAVDSPATAAWIGRLGGELRAAGFVIDFLTLSIDPPAPCLAWPALDRAWRWGDRRLLAMYERLAVACAEHDLFVNGPGINLHPRFVEQLSICKAYACCDDPESSELLSRPVAAAYDFALVANLAEVETYRSWGVRNAHFWPMGFVAHEHDPGLTSERILTGDRENDLALVCERRSPWRRERLDAYASSFPGGVFRGAGWPAGRLAEDALVPLLQRTRIGPNFHNSTGPVNSRTYTLPANGVLQICDNRSHLAQLFELDREVVGFDTLAEALDKTRYYLAHEEERRRIAAAGFLRSKRDYSQRARFTRLLDLAAGHLKGRETAGPQSAAIEVVRQRRGQSVIRQPLLALAAAIRAPLRLAKRLLRCILGRHHGG